jgi:HEAT repeat protein
MQTLGHFPFPSHGLIRSNYDVLFVVSGLMRFFILYSAISITERNSRSAGYVLGQLRAGNPIVAASAIQRLSRSGESAARVRAASALGRMKAPIAVEELVRALDDPALPVREKAAEALGEIGDSRAVYPLLDKLKDPGSGIATEAAVALGKIGDDSALPELLLAARNNLGLTPRRAAAVEAIGMLSQLRVLEHLAEFVNHPYASLRIAALRAISGRSDISGSPSVRVAVVERWRGEEEESVLPLLADAIAQLGDPLLAVELAEGMSRVVSAVTRRELLNSIGSLLGGRDSFYAYLALDRFASDDTFAKILSSLQRQFRPSRGAPDARYAARFTVRIQQALAAYADGHYRVCARRLNQAGELVVQTAARRGDSVRDAACLGVLRVFDERCANADPGYEELLAMVFIVRILAVG